MENNLFTMSKCILLASVALWAFVAMSSVEANSPASVDPKFVKNIEKINDYLEKNVQSDDLETNVAKAEQWLKGQSRLTLFFDRSFKDALQLIIWLPVTVQNATSCKFDEWSRSLLEKSDEGLMDATRLDADNKLGDPNYVPKRIDRILENVAYKNVRLCRLNEDRPLMGLTFKQFAYDHINDHLVDNIPNEDPETNMAEAEQMLKMVNNREGSYAKALEQLVALKSILNEDSCNEQGTEIVLKNDLATRGDALEPETEIRVSKLVRHYIVQHSSVCLPFSQADCSAKLNQFDAQTYRRVLGITSAHQLHFEQFDELLRSEFITKLVSNEDESDFHSEKLHQYLEAAPESILDGFGNENLYIYLKVVSEHDPRASYLKRGPREERIEKFKELFDEYIQEPCEKFNNLMGTAIEVLAYKLRIVKSQGENNTPPNLLLLPSAYKTCRDVTMRKEYYIEFCLEIMALTNGV